MKKEALVIFLVILLVVMPFSSAQFSSIEIEDVNVNDNAIQVLVQNNVDKDFNQEVFIINNQQQVIREEILSNFTAKFFVVNYPTGIKLESLQVIINDNTAKYDFTGTEDSFNLQQNTALQEASQAIATTESNSPVSYIYSGSRVAKIQDNNVVYYSSDNVGSTSLETDSSGTINFKANYLPFGKELSFSSINDEKYGFTSKEFDDESNLNYFNARYYNPSSGKFISNDPIFKPSEGGYQYVRNNPLTITDPSGKGGCRNGICPVPDVVKSKESYGPVIGGTAVMPSPSIIFAAGMAALAATFTTIVGIEAINTPGNEVERFLQRISDEDAIYRLMKESDIDPELDFTGKNKPERITILPNDKDEKYCYICLTDAEIFFTIYEKLGTRGPEYVFENKKAAEAYKKSLIRHFEKQTGKIKANYNIIELIPSRVLDPKRNPIKIDEFAWRVNEVVIAKPPHTEMSMGERVITRPVGIYSDPSLIGQYEVYKAAKRGPER